MLNRITPVVDTNTSTKHEARRTVQLSSQLKNLDAKIGIPFAFFNVSE